jgi:hypothetical protein
MLIVSIIIIILIITPFPSGSRTYNIGVDENLWAAYDYGGIITVNKNALNITALNSSRPTVHVATSAWPYVIEFDAVVFNFSLPQCLFKVSTDDISNWRLLSSSKSVMLKTENGNLELIIDPALVNECKVQVMYDFGSDGVNLDKALISFLTYSNYTGYPFNVGVYDVRGNWGVWGIWHWPNGTWLQYVFNLSTPMYVSESFPDLTKVRCFFLETSADSSFKPAVFLFRDIWFVIGDFSQPIVIDVWDTPTRSNVTVLFTPMGTIEIVDSTACSPPDKIATYARGHSYHFKIIASTTNPIMIEVSNSTWKYLYKAHQIFKYYVAVSISARSVKGTTKSIIGNFSITFPSHGLDPFKPFWSYVANINSLYLLYFFLLSLIIILYVKPFCLQISKFFVLIKKNVFCLRYTSRQRVSLLTVIFVVLGLSVILSPLGNHPFDWYAQRLYSYVAAKYGLESIYSMSHLLSTAIPWGGRPPHHLGFPYGPLFADFYWLLGAASVPLGLSQGFNTFSFEFLFKMTQVIFAILTGLIIFSMSRRLSGRFNIALFTMLLYVLNPAILFDAAIWAITDSLLILLLLAAAVSLELKKCTLTWVFVGLSFLTKSTAIPMLFFISVLALKKFGFRRSILGISHAINISFLVTIPLLFAGYSPSIIYSVVVGKIFGFDTPWNTATGFSATLDAFNIWPLLTYLMGARGDARFTYLLPSSMSLVGEIPYILIAVIMLMTVLFDNGRSENMGSSFPILVIIALALPMLQMDKISRYFLLAFPFLILSFKNLSSRLYHYLIATFSVTTFISMYGLFVMHTIRWPWALAPTNFIPSVNAANGFIAQIFTNDVFITICSVANLIGFVLLLRNTLRIRRTLKNALSYIRHSLHRFTKSVHSK